MTKLLIVDDEVGFCKCIGELLTKEGYEVITANSGQEAIQKVKNEKPQLILLDILMPGMDGIQTLKEIKQIDKDAVVTIVTAVKDSGVVRKAFRLGAVNLFSKPVNIDLLKKSLKTWSDNLEIKQFAKSDILVVDFDEDKCKTIVDIFSKKGYNIKIVLETNEAQLNEPNFDLVFIRADCLGEQAIDIFSRIRETNPVLPVLVSVKEDQQELIGKLRAIGADNHLANPYTLPHLIFAVFGMLTRNKQPIAGQADEAHYNNCIIVVDDEPEICDYIEKFLSQQGYRVYAITDPKRALKEIESIHPAIVMLDIVMPQIDGLQVLERIKKMYPDIRVIMLTGVKDDFICKQAISEGASDYLVKPFSLDQLKFTLLSNSIKARHN
jgi:DNA-binding response OmpR family regulator